MLSAELKQLISGEVSTSEADLGLYSHDASIFEVKPQVVVHPKDTEDLKKLVSFVSQKKSSKPELSLTARAAGSDMTGGPLGESIILDFTTHFNKIHEVGESFAVVEPGVFYRNFEKETAKKDLIFPSYPASKSLCAWGGIVSNNSGGEKSLYYGKTIDYVEELNMVLSDGNEYVFKALDDRELEAKKSQDDFEGKIYREMHELVRSNEELINSAKPRVSKNSAGYQLWNISRDGRFDLAKLFVGAQGTLGLITKIKVRLVKPKKHSRMLVIFLNDLKPLGHLVNIAMSHKPESFESYDRHTLNLALRFLPGLMKKMGGNFISLAFRFIPDMWMALTNGLPELVLIAEFTGDNEKEVQTRTHIAEKEIREKFGVRTRIATSADDAQKYWTIRRESFNLLRQHVQGKHAAPFIDDIIVNPEKLPEFLPKLNDILDKYTGLVYTIAGHAGDGNFHIIPLMNLAEESSRKMIPVISEEVYNLVVEYGGSITAEHNDGLIRTPYLSKMFRPEVIALFEKTKNIFDPMNILNPGKKVGGSLDYAMSHIKKN